MNMVQIALLACLVGVVVIGAVVIVKGIIKGIIGNFQKKDKPE